MKNLEILDIPKIYVSDILRNTQDDKNLLLIGFGFTHPAGISKLRDSWGKSDNKDKAVGRTKEQTSAVKIYEVGGAVTLLDLNLDSGTPQVLAELDIQTPMGLCYYPLTQELLIGSAYDIKVLKQGKLVRSLNNNLFNQIHAIKLAPEGVYVTCTMADALVQIDPLNPGFSIWDWLATEQGYSQSKSGPKTVDRSVNYQKIEDEGSRTHTTHINCVESLDADTLLATLFHQDCIIQIDKRSKGHKVVFSDLVNPHGIHKIKDGFIVSDTRGNRALVLDINFKIKHVLQGDLDWVQDAVEFDDYFVVGNDNKGRLEIFNKMGVLLDQISWGSHLRKMSVLSVIKASDAKHVFLAS